MLFPLADALAEGISLGHDTGADSGDYRTIDRSRSDHAKPRRIITCGAFPCRNETGQSVVAVNAIIAVGVAFLYVTLTTSRITPNEGLQLT